MPLPGARFRLSGFMGSGAVTTRNFAAERSRHDGGNDAQIRHGAGNPIRENSLRSQKNGWSMSLRRKPSVIVSMSASWKKAQ
jgi:hypothetical protein